MFKHPNYYKELEKIRKEFEASLDPEAKATSNKRQAASTKRQAAATKCRSDDMSQDKKQQATSSKRQATSHKRQATSSKNFSISLNPDTLGLCFRPPATRSRIQEPS